VDMAEAIRAAVVAAEKAKAAGAAAIDFRTKTTASRFASRANRAGSGSRRLTTPTNATERGPLAKQGIWDADKSLEVYRGGKWLVAISVTAGVPRINFASPALYTTTKTPATGRTIHFFRFYFNN
jgi:hypothetical protein